MKRMIRCSQVSDMTQRYPEGERGYVYEDYKDFDPSEYKTLSEVLDSIEQDINDGDYYRWIRFVKDGKVIFETSRFDDTYKEFRNAYSILVERWMWHDDVITVVLY